MRPWEYQAPLAGSFKGDSPIDVARETLAGLSFFCYLCSWTSFCSYVKLTCFHGVVRACMYFYLWPCWTYCLKCPSPPISSCLHSVYSSKLNSKTWWKLSWPSPAKLLTPLKQYLGDFCFNIYCIVLFIRPSSMPLCEGWGSLIHVCIYMPTPVSGICRFTVVFVE